MSHPRLERFARLFALAVYTVATFSFAGISHAGGPVLPSGYSLTPVATGLNLPTNLAWLPDGTQLLVEKAGFVRTIKNGVVSSTPMVDITATTNDYWDRGLLGVAVDPDYTNNHYLYLLHTYENNKSDYTGTKMNQLLRVTIDPATGIMVAGSTVVLLGTQTPATSCQDLPATADCIPSDSPSHSVGDVVFAPDGTLFVTSGDGSSFDYTDPLALRAQNLDNLNGKMLHIDRNGKGLSTNPFYTGNVGDNRSKVWAYGLRNPWRFAFKPGTSVPYIADVGYATWEEVNVAQAGRNFGWPCYEGAAKQPDYSSLSGCKTLYSHVAAGTATVTPPLTATNHNGQQSAITGGAWVTGTNYPAALQGTFVYGDYALGTMHTLRTDANHALTGAPTDFGNGLTGPVDFEQGPDGNLYVLQISDAAGNLGTGALYRLDYQDVGSGSCPTGQFNAQYFNGATPSGTPVISGCEATPLNHDWGQGSPGAGVNTDNWSARYTGSFSFNAGAYTFNAGAYTFNAGADDGVRVLVDGVTVIDGWKDQALTNYTGTANLTAGAHTVEVDYYDSGWDAALKVNWSQTGGQGGGCIDGQFTAQYFNGLDPNNAGQPVITQCETAPLTHDWGQGSPGAGVNTDNWSAKYTGTFAFNAGDYTFNTSSDDGVRVLVDGATVVDGWKDQATTAYTTTRAMTAGDHTVEIDYYDSGWDANLTAGWQQVMRKAPTLTIKNPADAALVPIGSTVNFSGSAVDADGVAVPASGLTWNAVVKHCPNGQDCHNHFLQSFDGVASGSFVYPDHGIDPYHIELSLTATDAKGATATKTISLYPDRAATCAASSISVQYFNNKTLSGSPVATDCVTAINYDWGLGSPVAPVNADNFSARFTTTQTFAAGTYKFTLTGDDGIRLYIDGTLFLSGWKDQGTTTYTKNKILTTGNHTIKVEYYDSGYNAVAKASWVKL
jgi:glucose/arabinose dehydrogenase